VERLFGVFSHGVFKLVFLRLVFFLWSQICSFRLVFPRHMPLHVGRLFLPVQQPPTTALLVLHARRVAYTRQGSLSLDRRVWVTACLPRCNWGFFDGFEVFQRVSVADEVFGGVS
jgi:hypothetical protein